MEEQTVIIVNRNEWGALSPTSVVKLESPPVSYVSVFWTDSAPCENAENCVKAVQDLQKKHMTSQGLPDIAYNFLIGGDGRVYEGRGWDTRPVDNRNYSDVNGLSIMIGLIGWRNDLPTEAMIQYLDNLIDYGKKNKNITDPSGLLPVYD